MKMNKTAKKLSCMMSLFLIIGSMTACGAASTSTQTEDYPKEEVVDVEDTAELMVGEPSETDEKESTDLSQEELITYRLIKEIYTERLYTTETEYDELGNAIKETTYAEGTELEVTEREFDDDSKILREISTYLFGDGPSVTVWEYDEFGNKTAMYEENESGEKLLVSAWKYDAACNMTKEMKYRDENVVSTKEYFYDEAGNQIKAYFYDESDSLTDEIFWEYDVNGNKISEMDYWNGSLYSHMEWEYDEKGNMIKAITHNDDGSQYIVSMKYDDVGNRIEMNTDYEGDGNIDNQIRNEIVYDEAGNMVKDTRYDSENKIEYTIEYEYMQIKN